VFDGLVHQAKPGRLSVLDLGGSDGSYLGVYADSVDFDVTVADIDENCLARARADYGFKTVLLTEDDRLPFKDKEFDFVFCNSVIEHVTVPKKDIWKIRNGAAFRNLATKRQILFANEIRRIGKGYFVQTPYKLFPVENHAWLPFVQFLPRSLLVRLIKITNRFWVKKTNPDWYLLNRREMRSLFPDAAVFEEKVWGTTKSLIAMRRNESLGTRESQEV
jgi:hypothetical protein